MLNYFINSGVLFSIEVTSVFFAVRSVDCEMKTREDIVQSSPFNVLKRKFEKKNCTEITGVDSSQLVAQQQSREL